MFQSVNSPNSCLSIRLVVAVLSAVAITAAGGIALGVTMSYTISASEDYALQYVSAISETGKRKILDFLGAPFRKVDGFQAAMRDNMMITPVGTTGAARWDVVRFYMRFLYHAMKENPQTTTNLLGTVDDSLLQCNTPDGEFIGCGWRDGLNTTGTGTSLRRGQWDVFYNASTGAYLYERTLWTTYTPKGRDWYESPGNASMAKFISKRFITATYRKAVFSVSGAVVDHSGAFVGIIGLFSRLEDLSTYLRELPQTPNAAVVLLDNEDYVLGSSREASDPLAEWFPYTSGSLALPPRYHNDCENITSIKTYYCPHHVANYSVRVFAELAAARPGLVASGSPDPIHLDLPSGSYYAAVRAITMEGGTNLHWRVVTLIPEADINARIVEGRNLAIIFVGVSVVVCVAVSLVGTWLLLRPLTRVAARMVSAASFNADDDDDDERNGRVSALAEVATIQKAFATLSDQVRRARQYLPASLLAPQSVDDDDNEDNDDDGAARSEASHLHASLEGSVQPSSGGDHSSTGDHPSHPSRSGQQQPYHNLRRQRPSATATPDTHTSTSHSKSTAASAAVAALRSDIGLARRKASILYANVRGFNALVAAGDAGTVAAEYASVVSAATQAAAQHRGILDAFHGDRFVLTFNAARACGSHAAAATQAALGLTNAAIGIALTCGVASGGASVGNLGSDAARRFHTISDAFSRATLLERLCSVFGVPILLARGTATDADLVVRTLLLDALPPVVAVPSPLSATTTPWMVPAPARRAMVVATALGQRGKAAADEWMYEISRQGAADPASALSEAVAALLDSDDAATAAVHLTAVHEHRAKHATEAALLGHVVLDAVADRLHRALELSNHRFGQDGEALGTASNTANAATTRLGVDLSGLFHVLARGSSDGDPPNVAGHWFRSAVAVDAMEKKSYTVSPPG